MDKLPWPGYAPIQVAEYQTPRHASRPCGSQLSSTFSAIISLWVGWIQYTAMMAHMRITLDSRLKATVQIRIPCKLHRIAVLCGALRCFAVLCDPDPADPGYGIQVAAHIRMEPQNTAEKDEMNPLTKNCSSGNMPTTRTNPQPRQCRHKRAASHDGSWLWKQFEENVL